MSLLNRSSWRFVVAAISFSWIMPVFAQPPGALDVKAFGAQGDGQSDDTQAIQQAADAAAAKTIAFQPAGGAYLGSSPPVYFPAGHYKISAEINFGGYTNVISDAQAIVEQTAKQRIFVFSGGYTNIVRGLRFLRGSNQLYFANANVDTTTICVEQCEFQLSEDYAIYTIGTTDGHLSANMVIDQCKFIFPRQVLHNACDASTVRDCWVTIGKRNFNTDTGAFVNRSGVLMMENMFGVPVFEDFKEHQRVRWIDNYDQVLINRSRFGGEYAGIPVLHHFGKAGSDYPWMGQSVIIENSQLSSGPSADPHSAVITLREGLPQLIRLVGNRHLIDASYIRADGLDLKSHLELVPRAASRFQIVLESNMDLPASPMIPEELNEFVQSSR